MMHGCGRLDGGPGVSARALFKEDIYRFRPPPQRVLAAFWLQDCFNAFKSPQRRSCEQPIGWELVGVELASGR